MNKRIGILVNSYRASTGLDAGGHVHFIEVAKRWKDIDVVLFGPAEARLELLAALPEASFVAIPQLRTPHWRLDQIARLFGGLSLRAELRSLDAILCTSHFIADVLAAVAARPSRTVVTLHHMIGPPWSRQGPLVPNTVAWLSQTVSLIVARIFVRRFIFDCTYVAETSRWATGEAARFISTNGVSGSNEKPANLEGRMHGVYLGRLDPMKRVADAIRAWALLPKRLADHKLHLIGDGAIGYRRRLEGLARELGVGDRIIFHGRVDDAAKWRLLRESAIFVFPSAEEGWGISVAEAMAAGLPCITYDLPVFRSLFYQGRRAVALGDVEALANECEALLTHEDIRLRMAADALDLSQSFRWERAAEVELEALTF